MAAAESEPADIPVAGVAETDERDADRTIVWVRGEQDIATVAALSQSLARAIAVDDGDLVVDVSGTEFMSAATVGIIVRTSEFLHARSRSLVLRSPTAGVRRTLEICGLSDLIAPPTSHATHPNGAAAALGTWVWVPTTDPVDPTADGHGLATAGSVDAAGRVPATDPTTGEPGTR